MLGRYLRITSLFIESTTENSSSQFKSLMYFIAKLSVPWLFCCFFTAFLVLSACEFLTTKKNQDMRSADAYPFIKFH